MRSLEFLCAWRERAGQWQEKVPAPAEIPPARSVENALMAGDPLITLVAPTIPPDLFAAVLADLAGLYAQAHRDGKPLADRLAGATGDQGRELSEALLNGRSLPEWVADDGVAQLVRTLAGLALQPFMLRFARAVSAGAPLSMWRKNLCPVCGAAPDVARIDPDNLRFLHCPQCDTQWEHHRLTCVTCDTDDAKQVSILTLEAMEPWRVEVCGACGGYTKSLDQRHGGYLAMPKVDLYLEDCRTLQLDLLAEQEGYRRGGRVQ